MNVNRILKNSLAAMFIAALVTGSCNKVADMSTTALTNTVSMLNCSAATFSGGFTSGAAYSGSASVPYTGGDGTSYAAGSAIASTGVTGLTATLQAGTLASGSGSLTYEIKGTPTASGTATFAITFGGQSCSISFSTATSTVDCNNATTPAAKVVCAANTLMASLSTTQISTLVQTYSKTNVIKWSNLPCGSNCRVGLQIGTLTAAQLTLAKAVVQAATGTTPNDGYDEAFQINAADDVLAASGGGNGYSSGIYFLAFLGTPTTTGTWQLQFGGHHLAINITYEAGAVKGASPYFEGIEPKTWTSNGVIYAPLGNEQSTMATMLAGLSTTQLASAKLSSTFSDVVLGPNQDGKFPTTKVGLSVNSLTEAQKLLVLEAIKPWVRDVDDATAASLLTIYQNELANTYVAYSGNASLSNNADYVRIDGPSVWIEFVCQSGVVYRNEIHYHSIWRDHTRDYGGNFTF